MITDLFVLSVLALVATTLSAGTAFKHSEDTSPSGVWAAIAVALIGFQLVVAFFVLP